jgi:hypothetical protein
MSMKQINSTLVKISALKMIQNLVLIMPLNEVMRPCYLVIDQLAFLMVDFSAIFWGTALPTFESLLTTKTIKS